MDGRFAAWSGMVTLLLAGWCAVAEAYAPSPLRAGAVLHRPSALARSAGASRMTAGTFEELGVRAELVEALRALGLNAPNKLQSQALPVLNGGGDLVLGAQTGSGKTLTYLLPLLQRLKDEEDFAGAAFVQRPSRPRALVIVPTRELGEQVTSVAKSVCHYIKLRSVCVSGGVPHGKQAKLLAGALDVLVATPGRLLAHADAGNLAFSATSIFVVDEVDTIFEAGFGDDMRKLLRLIAFHRGDAPVQHVAVGATHPNAAKKLYAEAFPAARELMVDVHTVPRSLAQRFVPVGSQPTDKCEALIDALGPPGENGDLGGCRTLVFCNSKDSARFVDHYLTEARYKTSNYHGGILPEARSKNFKEFKEGKTDILVCSDLAARGLDGLDISHVVQFDFARSVVDYLHRSGRTARAGKRGRVTSLVTKYDTALAKEVQGTGNLQVTSHTIKPAGEKPTPSTTGRPAAAAAAAAAKEFRPSAAERAGAPRERRAERAAGRAADPAPPRGTVTIKRGTRGSARFESKKTLQSPRRGATPRPVEVATGGDANQRASRVAAPTAKSAGRRGAPAERSAAPAGRSAAPFGRGGGDRRR
ncbi:P-loop containing nucleoside triphosphate hydrolase protein [Pavlovales sp. CCMP2436]|nr:P-loop containing nucleoside triphosphate hydrolase protein [Pavlovales sp. CCMP2436]